MKKLFTFLLLLSFLYLDTSNLHAKDQPFFQVEWKDGKAWLLTPSRRPFLSMGVNAIADQSYRAPNDHFYNPVKNQYHGNKKDWIKSVFTRLKKWHFNTIGSWADEALLGQKFPYTMMLYIGRGNPWDDVLLSVFTEDFEERVKQNAQKAAPYRNDPFLIGYFLDNEMPWWGDFGWHAQGQKTLLEKYSLKGVDDSNKKALEKFFKNRYDQDILKFDEVWCLKLQSFDELDAPVDLTPKTKKQQADASAWVGVVADRYFSVTTQALKAVDPNHLILGVRFAGENPWEAVEACAHYCDVVSVNTYEKSGNVNQTLLDNFYARSQKPILISEYSFSAMENQSADPNNHGADVAFPTQKERALHLNQYARQLLRLPYIVGLHWFEWSDESPEGRFDGENCNYGLVDLKDNPYDLLTKEQTNLNLIALPLHQKSGIPLPIGFKENLGPDYRKANAGMKIPSTRNFLRIDNSAHVDTWGDGVTGGKAIANTTTGVIILDYQTGSGWGCGASLSSNIPPLGEGGSLDLRGYNFLQFKAFVPKDVHFTIYLSESGCAAPGQESYDGKNGADGESYSFPPLTGTGKWEEYRVDFSELQRRTEWGNQKGNNILDLQALQDIEFYLSQNQGSGRMLIKDLKLMVK